MSASPLLSIESLSITLGGQNIVEGLDLTLDRGETLAIVGESGCGKSVTALALMGLLPAGRSNAVTGRVTFEGRNLLDLDHAAMADLRGNRLAMIFQEPMTALNPVFRVGDQITESIVRHRGMSRTDARARAVEMLTRVRVPEPEARLQSFPHELSGGMRQRVMIAMALANDPAVIIADEPTTALDVTIQAQILALVDELARENGTATILITHDLGVVAEMADRVAVMYAGRLVETASSKVLFDDPQHPYTLGLMSSIPPIGGRLPGRLATIPGSVPPPRLYGSGCRFTSRCPFAEPACAETTPVLAEPSPGHRVACRRAPLEGNVDLAALEVAA